MKVNELSQPARAPVGYKRGVRIRCAVLPDLDLGSLWRALHLAQRASCI